MIDANVVGRLRDEPHTVRLHIGTNDVLRNLGELTRGTYGKPGE